MGVTAVYCKGERERDREERERERQAGERLTVKLL
jgi:hypothetical protein